MEAIVQHQLALFLLLIARVSAFIGSLPYFGARSFPNLAKAALVLSLSAFWILDPAVQSAAPQLLMEDREFLLLAVREVGLGLAMGMMFSLFIIPFRVAGEFIGQEMGLTLATLTDPTQNQRGSVFGQNIELIGVFLFFSLGFYRFFFRVFAHSLSAQAIGRFELNIPVARYVDALQASQEYGLSLAAPVVCCLIVTTLILALMARAAPQLNIMSIGFVLRLGVGATATFVFLPHIHHGAQWVLHDLGNSLVGAWE